MDWQLPDRTLDLTQRPLVLGIVNVTPDSFSDGGRFAGLEEAVRHGLELVEQGADLLDIGGESSRPGALPIPLDEELRRVVPVVRELARHTTVPLSVDTTKAEVARQALSAGAHIINDITVSQNDPAMIEVVRTSGAGVILMHMQGRPADMQVNPHYDSVFDEVRAFLEARLQALADLGISAPRMVLDPGIGFGKTEDHNWQLLARLHELGQLGRPICLGVSRKGFLGRLPGPAGAAPAPRPVEQRLAGSLACVYDALEHRSAQIFRVHDVAATRDVLAVYQALLRRRTPGLEAKG